MKAWILVLVAASCTNGSASPPSGSAADSDSRPSNGEVVRVIDGDTVDIDFDGTVERVRLIGIDTPETKKPESPVECFGPEASAFTEGLLAPGTPVHVERDTVARDDFGRLLGYVYRTDDGLFVNLEIIASGHAEPLTIPPNDTFAGEFVGAADDAETADLGLWAACSG